jgi:CDP-4-dehydro-6-deoxyglucose reductase
MLNGQSFHSEEGSTLLDAGLSSGITLPYSCKSGRCSSCKSKILSGKTRAFQPEVGLSVTQKAEGWVLSCVRTACSDITLDIEDISNFVLPPKGTWPCRIYKIERLSNDVVRVLLRIPPKSDFSSIPGQFIDVIGPNGIRRSYSLANVFVVNGFIELHIRAVANGVMSDYWFKHANENDLLRFHGPLGTFFLRPIAARDLIFLATGTGIAPVKAMLESLVDISLDVRPRSVTVFWGGRSVDDFYWDVHSIPVGQRFVPVLSRPTSSWMGEVGYVQDVFLKQNPELDNSVVYACGSNAMIQSAQEKLTQAGLSPSLFFSDAFVCSSP